MRFFLETAFIWMTLRRSTAGRHFKLEIFERGSKSMGCLILAASRL
jgi:hypothetical protein